MTFRFNKRLSWQVDSASDVQSDVVKQSKTTKFLLAGLAAGLGYLTLMTRVPFCWGWEGRAVAEFLIFPDALCVCVCWEFLSRFPSSSSFIREVILSL